MNALEMNHVTKSYGSFTLNDICLSLPQGTIMGLVGENGAGKTTCLKLLLGIITADSGTLHLLDCDNPRAHREVMERIGVVMDDVKLPAALKMNEIGDIMAGIYKQWDAEYFNRLCTQMHIPADTKFSQLSRGNRMKAGIACALSHNPELLILDEPTSGLDPVARDELLDVLLEFTRDEKHSVLMSSHIVSDLEKVCDYITFLHEGMLILSEEKDVLKESYGVFHCTPAQLAELNRNDITGSRETAYGCEVIMPKDKIPAGFSSEPVDLEELFVLMIKGEKHV